MKEKGLEDQFEEEIEEILRKEDIIGDEDDEVTESLRKMDIIGNGDTVLFDLDGVFSDFMISIFFWQTFIFSLTPGSLGLIML